MSRDVKRLTCPEILNMTFITSSFLKQMKKKQQYIQVKTIIAMIILCERSHG